MMFSIQEIYQSVHDASSLENMSSSDLALFDRIQNDVSAFKWMRLYQKTDGVIQSICTYCGMLLLAISCRIVVLDSVTGNESKVINGPSRSKKFGFYVVDWQWIREE